MVPITRSTPDNNDTDEVCSSHLSTSSISHLVSIQPALIDNRRTQLDLDRTLNMVS
jgi:hypothetical protein